MARHKEESWYGVRAITKSLVTRRLTKLVSDLGRLVKDPSLLLKLRKIVSIASSNIGMELEILERIENVESSMIFLMNLIDQGWCDC